MIRYSSRKFIISLLTLFVSSWLTYERILTPDLFSKVVLGTVGAYIIGNVGQKFIGVKNGTDVQK